MQTEAVVDSIENKQIEEVVETKDPQETNSGGELVNAEDNGTTTGDEETSDTGNQQTDLNSENSSNGETASINKQKLADNQQTTNELDNKDITIEQAHFEALSKFLDVSGSKLNYRRYGEVLLDILIAGGTLAPGGSIVKNSDPTKPSKTDLCLFSIPENNLADIKNFAQVIHKLIRRYLYLEKILDDEIKKLLLFLKGFSPEIRKKLASFVAILISIGQIPATVLGKFTYQLSRFELNFFIKSKPILINSFFSLSSFCCSRIYC